MLDEDSRQFLFLEMLDKLLDRLTTPPNIFGYVSPR